MGATVGSEDARHSDVAESLAAPDGSAPADAPAVESPPVDDGVDDSELSAADARDRRLVRRARGGDARAFEELVSQ